MTDSVPPAATLTPAIVVLNPYKPQVIGKMEETMRERGTWSWKQVAFTVAGGLLFALFLYAVQPTATEVAGQGTIIAFPPQDDGEDDGSVTESPTATTPPGQGPGGTGGTGGPGGTGIVGGGGGTGGTGGAGGAGGAGGVDAGEGEGEDGVNGGGVADILICDVLTPGDTENLAPALEVTPSCAVSTENGAVIVNLSGDVISVTDEGATAGGRTVRIFGANEVSGADCQSVPEERDGDQVIVAASLRCNVPDGATVEVR